jgi:hypothetical protein
LVLKERSIEGRLPEAQLFVHNRPCPGTGSRPPAAEAGSTMLEGKRDQERDWTPQDGLPVRAKIPLPFKNPGIDVTACPPPPLESTTQI